MASNWMGSVMSGTTNKGRVLYESFVSVESHARQQAVITDGGCIVVWQQEDGDYFYTHEPVGADEGPLRQGCVAALVIDCDGRQ